MKVAKAKGRLRGKSPKLTPRQEAHLVQLHAADEHTVGELAEPANMSFAAASKHVQVLERAGMVNRRVKGRQHICTLSPKPLKEASDWLSFYEKFWDESLDRLQAMLEADRDETEAQE